MAKGFSPLRIISGYSFLQSGLTIDKAVSSVKKENYFGAALCDFNVLHGLPSFVEEMEKLHKPYLLGVSISLEDDYALYALNEEGYQNLIKLSALVSEEKLTEEEFKKHLKGVALILEAHHGQFHDNLVTGLDDNYIHKLAKISSLADVFYLGLDIFDQVSQDLAVKIRDFADKFTYQTIAFPRIRYQKKEDAIILKIVETIEKDERIEEKSQEGPSYFKSLSEYKALYNEQEIELTSELIEKNHFDFDKKRGQITRFPVENSELALREAVMNGLQKKNIADQEHIKRAEYELSVISSMKYSDYFLIVADYVSYAKNHNIIVGPGRGSAAGSLVSYALDITEVDPLDYDLQFERFLNKARKSMPDIDVDFMDTRRNEVVQYVRDKYGENRVCNIVTFQTIKAKQALRDIGRIYNVPTHHIDMLSKSITDKMTLREAYKKLETFRKLVDSDKYFLDIVALASKIENLPRQAGQHAAGIVLNDAPIEEVMPVSVDFEGHYTSQYEKDYLEKQGFLKMDFLSIRNLTTIDTCLKLIKENHHLDLDFYHIPYLNKDIFSLINKGMTAGIFQIESNGMKGAIKIMQPSSFEELATLIAIFRPGPLDNIKEYTARKNGQIKVNYPSEEIKKILSPTYGVLIYQEQITSLAVSMAGYTMEEADLFRRAVSHKEKDILVSAQRNFLAGAMKKGYPEATAKKVFNDILKFANYGFNKSHAIVYALVASRMAYLKYYYPLEFYMAILTTASGVGDSKFGEYVSELKARKLEVYPPDINHSLNVFIARDKGLLYPLNFIKGINESLANKIIDERMLNGNFKDFFDFVKRMYSYKINESTILKLIDAGAFDKLYSSRASLRNTVKYALQFAELSYGQDGQIILDDTLEGQKQYFVSHDDPLENLNAEYEALGIMLSDNPLKYKKDLLETNHVVSLNDAKESEGYINIAGIVSSIKTIKTRKNTSSMAFIKIFDENGELEVTVFPRLFTTAYALLEKNNILLIRGRYDKNDEKESFIAENITLLGE